MSETFEMTIPVIASIQHGFSYGFCVVLSGVANRFDLSQAVVFAPVWPLVRSEFITIDLMPDEKRPMRAMAHRLNRSVRDVNQANCPTSLFGSRIAAFAAAIQQVQHEVKRQCVDFLNGNQ